MLFIVLLSQSSGYTVKVSIKVYFPLVASFCLKGEGLNGSCPAVIDYTPYLKSIQRYVGFNLLVLYLLLCTLPPVCAL